MDLYVNGLDEDTLNIWIPVRLWIGPLKNRISDLYDNCLVESPLKRCVLVRVQLGPLKGIAVNPEVKL